MANPEFNFQTIIAHNSPRTLMLLIASAVIWLGGCWFVCEVERRRRGMTFLASLRPWSHHFNGRELTMIVFLGLASLAVLSAGMN